MCFLCEVVTTRFGEGVHITGGGGSVRVAFIQNLAAPFTYRTFTTTPIFRLRDMRRGEALASALRKSALDLDDRTLWICPFRGACCPLKRATQVLRIAQPEHCHIHRNELLYHADMCLDVVWGRSSTGLPPARRMVELVSVHRIVHSSPVFEFQEFIRNTFPIWWPHHSLRQTLQDRQWQFAVKMTRGWDPRHGRSVSSRVDEGETGE